MVAMEFVASVRLVQRGFMIQGQSVLTNLVGLVFGRVMSVKSALMRLHAALHHVLLLIMASTAA